MFAVVVLFVVSYVFSRRLNQQIMEPLNALSEGAKRIKEGNLKKKSSIMEIPNLKMSARCLMRCKRRF
ncbi:MAG: hypothetical protein ACLVI9_06865 [Anaerostipes hadrus]